VGGATGPLAGSEARRLRPLNVLVKPELTRNDWAAWGQAGVNGASTKKGCCPCPVGESASGLTSLPDTGRSRAGGGVPRPSPIRAVTAGALTGSLGRFSFESLRRSGSAENGRAGRAARRSSLEAPRPHGFSPMRVSSWSGGRDSMGCLGEARGLIGGALSSLPAGRPPREARPSRRAAAKGKSRRQTQRIDRGQRVLLLGAAQATTSRSVHGRLSNPSSPVHISTPIHRLVHNPP